MKALVRILIVLFIGFALVSCTNDSAENINNSIKAAIDTLDAVSSDSNEIELTFTGSTNQKEMLMLKEALNSLNARKIGSGFVCIDMSDLTGITMLDTAYFSSMKIIKTAKLPSKLKEVPKYMFNYCTSITEITLPEETTYAGFSAFDTCQSLKNLYIGSKVFELAQYSFCDTQEDLNIHCPETTKLYFLCSRSFDIPLINTIYSHLPVDSYLDVTKTIITKKGNEKTFNLSIKYSSDSDCIYLEEKGEQGYKKIVSYLKKENTKIKTSGTDIDGILAGAAYYQNQEIEITSPTDGSLWYSTSYQDVFYSRDGGEIVDFSQGNITINHSDSQYYYRIKGGNK